MLDLLPPGEKIEHTCPRDAPSRSRRRVSGSAPPRTGARARAAGAIRQAGARRQHVDLRAEQRHSGVRRGGRRGAVDVEMVADDGAAGVLGEEPALPRPGAVGRDVHPAAERDQPGIDGDALPVGERPAGSGREADAGQRDVGRAASVGPASGLQRERDAARGVAPVAAGAPVGGVAGEVRHGPGERDPSALSERVDVHELTVVGDPRALHRDSVRRVQPVDRVGAGQPRRGDLLAGEPPLGHRPVLRQLHAAQPGRLAQRGGRRRDGDDEERGEGRAECDEPSNGHAVTTDRPLDRAATGARPARGQQS